MREPGSHGRREDSGSHWLRTSAKAAQSWQASSLLGPCPGPTYLMGVRGLLLRRLGERSLGWKEKPSLMLSRTEGATYVKP